MKRAKEVEGFPYAMPTVCYFTVDAAGMPSQVVHQNKSDRPLLKRAYELARAGETTLYAVWPGKWRSDLFLIDDLDAFADAFGF